MWFKVLIKSTIKHVILILWKLLLKYIKTKPTIKELHSTIIFTSSSKAKKYEKSTIKSMLYIFSIFPMRCNPRSININLADKRKTNIKTFYKRTDIKTNIEHEWIVKLRKLAFLTPVASTEFARVLRLTFKTAFVWKQVLVNCVITSLVIL